MKNMRSQRWFIFSKHRTNHPDYTKIWVETKILTLFKGSTSGKLLLVIYEPSCKHTSELNLLAELSDVPKTNKSTTKTPTRKVILIVMEVKMVS